MQLLQEAGRTPGPVWTGAEYLVSAGIRSPDRPFRSELLKTQVDYVILLWNSNTSINNLHVFSPTQPITMDREVNLTFVPADSSHDLHEFCHLKQFTPRPFLSASSQIHYSPIAVAFDSVCYEHLTASLHKPQIKYRFSIKFQ